MESELRKAVKDGLLDVHFLPQVNLQRGEVVGLEALARWNHPERGMLPAAEFIPVAEQSDLVVDVGGFVLEEAMRNAVRWRHETGVDLHVAVNVSARQLTGPELPGMVAEALVRFDLPPEALCLEMTEAALMDDPEGALESLRDLKDLGVSLASDEVGLGTSVLGAMRRVPQQDVLKIGPRMIARMGEGEGEQEVVSALIGMAQALEMKAIAEGVETADQERWLRSLGADAAQGFYIGRPLPADQVGPLLAAAAASAAQG
jgi:EAL domain-containing protein (putative c-di-GMP-specific phosphodiesterase class I)